MVQTSLRSTLYCRPINKVVALRTANTARTIQNLSHRHPPQKTYLPEQMFIA